MVKISRQQDYHMAQQFDNAVHIDSKEAEVFVDGCISDDLGDLHMKTDHLTDGEYYYSITDCGNYKAGTEELHLCLTTGCPNDHTYGTAAHVRLEQDNIDGVKQAILKIREKIELYDDIKDEATILVIDGRREY